MATGEAERDRGPVPAPEQDLRVSDDERHRIVELLGEHAGVGRITLGELEERVGRVYAATTRGELAAVTADLPALEAVGSDRSALEAVGSDRPVVTPRRERKPTRWLVAIMGGSRRGGRWRLSGRVNVVAIMGGDDIDLRGVEIEGGELLINVVAIMGGPSIYVPDTVEVELTGTAIMGGNDERGSPRPPRPGAPLIRIRSFALMGGADIWRVPAEAGGLSLKQARRAARALERGE